MDARAYTLRARAGAQLERSVARSLATHERRSDAPLPSLSQSCVRGHTNAAFIPPLPRADPKTRTINLEIDPHHALVARTNIENAGLAKTVEVRVGAALDTLPQLERDGLAPFDFIFIDADKANIPAYFTWSLKLSRPGTIVVIDNVVREGAVADAMSDDPAVRGVRLLNELLAAEPRVSATTIQTVGSKGYDGFTLALVVG